jgi:ABC-2 type transport system permease protein
MGINSIWDERLKEFYIEIVKYFLIIAMSVFYSFIIFGSVFLYYYLKFLQWLPPYFPIEIIASLLITVTFLTTSVRTFVKKADIIYLMPAETRLSSYFRKSMFYSAFMDAIKLLIMMIIIGPLIKHSEIINIAFLITFLGLIILNVHLTWIEQWLTNKYQMLLHRVIRFLSFFTIIHFMFIGMWTIAGILMIINSTLWFYAFDKKVRGINWGFLINQEEKSLLKIYKVINIYIDVPYLKHSFKRRQLLGWWIKKAITYKQSSSYVYLFSHLFIRYDEFYYLYVRLTLIGCSIIYFLPAYGWIVTFPLLFISGYQLLPIHYSINDSSRIYPISTSTVEKSFKKLVMNLLILQLIFLNLASFSHIYHIKSIFMIFTELLFIYWFVYFFASKRIFKQTE